MQRLLRLQARDRAAEQRAVKYAPMPLRDPSVSTLFGYMDTASGVSVTEWTAMNYSAFWAANKVFGEALGILPLRLMKKKDGGSREEVTDHDLVPLIEVAPNPEMTPTSGARRARSTARAGATASWRSSGRVPARPSPSGPSPPTASPPTAPSPGGSCTGSTTLTALRDTVPAEDMIHVPGMGFDGLTGYSVVSMARDCLGLGLATERFGSTFFGNGGHPSGILTYENKLNEQAHKNAAESWQLAHGGPDRSNKVAILDWGAKYTPISCPPEDAQFLQTREFNVLEVARWYNLPPHMLRSLEGQNRSTLEQQAIEFVVYSLQPWLIRWEQELRRKLLKPREQKRLFFHHNREPLLVGDVLSRFKAYALGRQWGWYSINDIRRKENENPIGPEGDVYLSPVNMVPAGQEDMHNDPDATPPEPGRAPASPKR
jgi:phage portal protein BeeE